MIPEIFIRMMTTLKWQKNIANSSIKLEDVKKELLKDPDVRKEYEKLLANLQKQSDLFGVTSEAARVRYAIERGELGELDAAQQQALLRYAQEIDAKRASGEASKAAAQASAQQTRQQEQYVRGLERSAALIGLSTDQVRAYELAEKGLTGALRDCAGAVTVGVNSFGKGIIQAVNPVGKNGAGFQMTVAQYFTPSGTAVHKVGIAPDYEVKLPEGDNGMYDFADTDHDVQLIKAIEVMDELLH